MSENVYTCFFGEKATVLNIIDNSIKDILKSYETTEIHIPALINKDVLEKVGYFKSFPKQISRVAYHNIGTFDKDKKIGNVVLSNYYLTPSACLHFYPMFGRYKTKDGIYTTRARVYRYEGDDFDENIRQWDFTVREIVVVGVKEAVTKYLFEICEKILKCFYGFGLKVELRNANDPFYPSKENNIKKKLQVANKQKQELIVEYHGQPLPIGSMNFHGLHFSKAFGFDNNNEVVTGCIGIGLERCVNAIYENGLQDYVLMGGVTKNE